MAKTLYLGNLNDHFQSQVVLEKNTHERQDMA
jgi:hypothetical protein